MRVLITGANGFVGKNLRQHLAERKDVEVMCFTRAQAVADLPRLLQGVDFVFHLAGENRPQDPRAFLTGNAELTAALVAAVDAEMQARGKLLPIVYTSSIQAARDNPYGTSKRMAEVALQAFAARTGAAAHVFRLPNVFGKWCKPDYNSAVATFCHNIARGLPIRINEPAASVTLVYVDDVVERFIQVMDGADAAVDAEGFATVTPQYTTTVGEMARLIETFRASRDTLMTERVGTGFVRALYATYVSYLPPESFAYAVPQHGDARGVFVEMLKTPDCGQFSFFTAHPGITRGGHYHHTKTEKFLVIKGEARFKFRHMQTGETHDLVTRGDKAEIVETVPGWTHDITNIGSEEMVVMLWANEVFDRARPDTYACPL
ncbi:NAD-dependent epimerase/dehydratase family protein [Azoarcus sp. KH32C]|uniref:UDP-2-acetamido-2,6-beta-L-arabino-hexul-4-ose reductase n=1 Tax=Azoarcus sp. KH32C TaxID=748247 RepID=UPI00023869FC|nr:NAD-dependent epimerase/dehydratase family protein [Azoarcus sp. KH32C]BAL23234.1 NAD dependent epimerase/dehydratase [Azoarcus sp. KH32C]